MKIIRDQIKLCEDCMFASVNGDDRDLTSSRAAEIVAGLEKLGPNLVPDFNSDTGRGYDEFSVTPCGCCETKLAGSRHDFAILGEDPGEIRLKADYGDPGTRREPVDRLILKLSVCATLKGEEYDKLTEDQLAVMVERLEKDLRRHLNYAVRSANWSHEELGMSVVLKKEI